MLLPLLLPLLLLLLPAAQGTGESTHATGMGQGGHPGHGHQEPPEPGGVGQVMPPLFRILFRASPPVSAADIGVGFSGGLHQDPSVPGGVGQPMSPPILSATPSVPGVTTWEFCTAVPPPARSVECLCFLFSWNACLSPGREGWERSGGPTAEIRGSAASCRCRQPDPRLPGVPGLQRGLHTLHRSPSVSPRSPAALHASPGPGSPSGGGDHRLHLRAGPAPLRLPGLRQRRHLAGGGPGPG